MESAGPFSDRLVRDGSLTRLVHLREVASTMDVAHTLAAEGAPAGTLVLADRQLQGRGRAGKSWSSEDGAGIWCTLIERMHDVQALAVLSLRVGMALADALDPFVNARVMLKWPNDLFVDGAKLGGILIEVRWRGAHPEWVAIGVGVNRRMPPVNANPALRATSVRGDVARDVLLAAMTRAMRTAAARGGALGRAELQHFAARDWAAGRQIVEPVHGTVRGISPDGGLVFTDADGVVRTLRSGSLQFA